MVRQMAKVQVLDFQVANLIAAGEVVERPASCVKELLENALDAGADEIVVEIKQGGISFIRVSDNGCGIDVEDLPIAIKRHATSKIQSAADLDGIMTLGFRGEALAAISSVSKLRIMTKTREAKFGALLVSEYGKMIDMSEIGCQNGTTVIVENLFANVPARRKFLKRDASEALAVAGIVEKLAISHPEIAFKLIVDGNMKLSTPGDNRLISAIYASLGKEFADKLVKVHNMTEGIEVVGYISRPESVKSNRSGQNFFVNGRYIRSKTAMAALEQAFDSYCEVGKFPFCVLFINIHPTWVDVNVHPTKLEVKFSNERAVFDAVYCAVRNTLSDPAVTGEPLLEPRRVTPTERGLYNAFVPIHDRLADTPTPDIPKARMPDEVTTLRTVITPETEGFVKASNGASHPIAPTATEARAVSATAVGSNPSVALVTPITPTTPTTTPPTTPVDRSTEGASLAGLDFLKGLSSVTLPEETGEISSEFDPKEEKVQPTVAENGNILPDYRIIGVAFHAYIMVEIGDTTLILDKHAAHERLLFEKMKKNREMSRSAVATQLLMVPLEVSLSKEELTSLDEYAEEFFALGFDFMANDHSAHIVGLPQGLSPDEALTLFATLAEGLAAGTASTESTGAVFYEKALYQASCKAAMKAGIIDTPENIKWLVEEVLKNPDVRYCPHGRPIAFELSRRDMEKFFKRT